MATAIETVDRPLLTTRTEKHCVIIVTGWADGKIDREPSPKSTWFMLVSLQQWFVDSYGCPVLLDLKCGGFVGVPYVFPSSLVYCQQGSSSLSEQFSECTGRQGVVMASQVGHK